MIDGSSVTITNAKSAPRNAGSHLAYVSFKLDLPVIGPVSFTNAPVALVDNQVVLFQPSIKAGDGKYYKSCFFEDRGFWSELTGIVLSKIDKNLIRP